MGYWDNKEVLITGGTGSLGKTLVKLFLRENNPKGIRIFSRDELKQWELRNEINRINTNKVPVSFLIGDIRDHYRLEDALFNVDVVIHTAAMKQIGACEENPIEAINTNVIGTQNLLRASIKNKVEKVMYVSTDKCVESVNLYGMTKGTAEKLFIHGNTYSGGRRPFFSCCRYGNVLGSRGSIVPLFRKQAITGTITITDERMTRFWITLNKVARFLLNSIINMRGGEIFIPKMPSCTVLKIAEEIAPNVEKKIIGIRAGEKLHETLISVNEGRNVIEFDDKYVITATDQGGESFSYSSDTNSWELTNDMLKSMLETA